MSNLRKIGEPAESRLRFTGSKIRRRAGLFFGVAAARTKLSVRALLPGTLLYPAYNCTVSALTALVGWFLFRERLTPRQWIGVGIGVAAVGVLCV